jgi:hypothetical protein
MGSSILLIQPGVNCSKLTKSEVAPICVNGDRLVIAGQQEVGFTLQQRYFRRGFYVCQLHTDA